MVERSDQYAFRGEAAPLRAERAETRVSGTTPDEWPVTVAVVEN
jgi:hypothetical protein